jgi:competence protein ComEA
MEPGQAEADENEWRGDPRVAKRRGGRRAALVGSVREAVGASAWAPLAMKLAGYLVGFVALALVGSGAATWRIGAANGDPALAMGLGPPPAADVADAAAPAADEHATDAGAEAVPTDAAVADGGGVTADGRVILNAASEDELRRLPGIGPSKAKAIVALRAKLGRFKRVEDLLRVRGIGRRSLARMRPLLVVDPP